MSTAAENIRSGYLQARQAAGATVAYSRAGSASKNFDCLIGQLGTDSFDSFRPADVSRGRSFIFLTEELKAVFGEPERGDSITVGDSVYHVAPIEEESHYRYSDPYEVLIRVFVEEAV